jgi:recombination endonuclease VII
VYANRDRYDELLELQRGRCAICGAEPGTRRLNIDHDHRTMELRGLLCHSCNRRLWPGVTIAWLANAMTYLETPPAKELT